MAVTAFHTSARVSLLLLLCCIAVTTGNPINSRTSRIEREEEAKVKDLGHVFKYCVQLESDKNLKEHYLKCCPVVPCDDKTSRDFNALACLFDLLPRNGGHIENRRSFKEEIIEKCMK